MAKQQATIIPVATEKDVIGARVLATSLRAANSSKKILALLPSAYFSESRRSILEVFDEVYCVEDNMENQKTENGSVEAKLIENMESYSELCILAPQSLVLENIDEIFDKISDFEYQMDSTSDVAPESNLNEPCFYFLLCPDSSIKKEMRKLACGEKGLSFLDLANIISDRLNQQALISLIGNFDVATGQLNGSYAGSPVIHFHHHRFDNLVERMKQLSMDLNLGLIEKKIVNTWLRFYHLTTTTTMPKLQNLHNYKNEPIAIVGISLRSPAAQNVDEFWNMLINGEDAITTKPGFRWTHNLNPRSNGDADNQTKAGFINAPIEEFDASFFGISSKDAQCLDPQARILYEVTWESLENAGINPQTLYATHTAIFAGYWQSDYRRWVECGTDYDYLRAYLCNSFGAVVARLSMFFGLTGPSLSLDTGCSAALSAVDLAVKSLRLRETNLALACGVNLLIQPHTPQTMKAILSQTSQRCNTFAAGADGYVRAEGCGALVLKRLETAVRDGDNIWAVIRGIGTAQEGVTSSFGRPTVHCETLAMKRALWDANVAPEQVSFIECHGTGTGVGDPIELKAISEVYTTPKRCEPLVIGSVKTNVGHTESCSGITGIVKAALAMKHGKIPKHLNVETINPALTDYLTSIPAIIPLGKNLEWEAVEGGRFCAVSCFGITGTDGHLILHEAPPNVGVPKFTLDLHRPKHLLKISAKTREALEQLLESYEQLFSKQASTNATNFADHVYTANVCRAEFSQYRVAFSAANFSEAEKILKNKSYAQAEHSEGKAATTVPKLCFLFSGQGSQYPGMAKTLYDTSPVFRIWFDRCDRILSTDFNVSLPTVLWGSKADETTLSRTIYSQTSIFCVEYCLLKLWESWGIKPNFVLGHSLGESCAAIAAGLMTLDQGLRLVAERSRLVDNLPHGSMLVVKASEKQVQELLKEAQADANIAALNLSDQTVVSGEPGEVEKFLHFLKSRQIKCTRLQATHAFHSAMLDPMLPDLEKFLSTFTFPGGDGNQEPEIGYISALKGELVKDGKEVDAGYWVRHLRQPVRFVDACAALKETGTQICVELGAQAVLGAMVSTNQDGITCLSSLRKNADDWHVILKTLEHLWLAGVPVNWEGFDAPYLRRKVSLPFYPFTRKSYWVQDMPVPSPELHPLAGIKLETPSTLLHIFEHDITAKKPEYLMEHVVGDMIIFPGAGFTEMIMSVGYWLSQGVRCQPFREEPPTRGVQIKNLKIQAPLQLLENTRTRLQTLVNMTSASTGGNNLPVQVHHRNPAAAEEQDSWIVHATAMVSHYDQKAEVEEDLRRHLNVLTSTEGRDGKAFYEQLGISGFKFGTHFQSLRKFWESAQETEVVAEVGVPAEECKDYLVHPLLIDAYFQSSILLTYLQEKEKLRLRVPVSLEQLAYMRTHPTFSIFVPSKTPRAFTRLCFERMVNPGP